LPPAPGAKPIMVPMAEERSIKIGFLNRETITSPITLSFDLASLPASANVGDIGEEVRSVVQSELAAQNRERFDHWTARNAVGGG
jgi:hypothetical protein